MHIPDNIIPNYTLKKGAHLLGVIFGMSLSFSMADDDLPLPKWDKTTLDASHQPYIVPSTPAKLDSQPEDTFHIDRFLQTGEIEAILREGQSLNNIDRAFQLYVPKSSGDLKETYESAGTEIAAKEDNPEFVTQEQVEDAIYLLDPSKRYLYLGRQLTGDQGLRMERFVSFLQQKIDADFLIVHLDPDQRMEESIPWLSFYNAKSKRDGFVLLVGDAESPMRLILRRKARQLGDSTQWSDVLGRCSSLLTREGGDRGEALNAALTEFAVHAIRYFGEKKRLPRGDRTIKDTSESLVQQRTADPGSGDSVTQNGSVLSELPIKTLQATLVDGGAYEGKSLQEEDFKKEWLPKLLVVMVSGLGIWGWVKKRNVKYARKLDLPEVALQAGQRNKKVIVPRVCSRSGFTCSFARGRDES